MYSRICLFLIFVIGLPLFGQAPLGTPPSSRTYVAYLGTYNSALRYTLNDEVSYNGVTYVSLVINNYSNQPDTSPTYWKSLSSVLAPGGNVYSTQYNNNGVLGGAPLTGIGKFSTTGPPVNATSTDIQNVLGTTVYDPYGTAVSTVNAAKITFPTGLLYGSGSTSAPSVATSTQVQNLIGPNIYDPYGSATSAVAAAQVTFPTGVLYGGNSTAPPTAATSSQIQGVIGGSVYDPFGTASGYRITFPSGLLFGANSLSAPTVATSSQVQGVIGANVYDAYGAGTTAANAAKVTFVTGILKGAGSTTAPTAAIQSDITSLIGSTTYDAYGAASTAQTNAEAALSGDVTKGAGAFTTVVTRVNGLAIPASTKLFGSNASSQFAAASSSDVQSVIGSSVYDAYGAGTTAANAAKITFASGLLYGANSTSPPTAATSTQVQTVIGAGVYDASGAATTAQTNAEAALTGDVTKAANAFATTLATVNASPATTACGDATHVCQFIDNGKGLVTSQSSVAISLPASTTYPSGLLYGAGTTAAPTAATSSQVQTVIGSGIYQPAGNYQPANSLSGNALYGVAATSVPHRLFDTSTTEVLDIISNNASNAGYSTVVFQDGSFNPQGGIGYGNTSVAITGVANKVYLYSQGNYDLCLLGNLSSRPTCDATLNHTTGVLTFTYAPVVPTQPASTNNTTVASTQYVDRAVGAATGGVTYPTGLLYGNGTTTAPTVATSSQVQSAIGSGVYQAAGSYQAAGNYLTGLTGDGTATGPGSVALTLATVNSSPATSACGDATHVCQFVDNGKGLVTSQTSVAISLPASTTYPAGLLYGANSTAAPTAATSAQVQSTIGSGVYQPNTVFPSGILKGAGTNAAPTAATAGTDYVIPSALPPTIVGASPYFLTGYNQSTQVWQKSQPTLTMLNGGTAPTSQTYAYGADSVTGSAFTISGGSITGTPISGSTVAGTTGTFSGAVSMNSVNIASIIASVGYGTGAATTAGFQINSGSGGTGSSTFLLDVVQGQSAYATGVYYNGSNWIRENANGYAYFREIPGSGTGASSMFWGLGIGGTAGASIPSVDSTDIGMTLGMNGATRQLWINSNAPTTSALASNIVFAANTAQSFLIDNGGSWYSAGNGTITGTLNVTGTSTLATVNASYLTITNASTSGGQAAGLYCPNGNFPAGNNCYFAIGKAFSAGNVGFLLWQGASTPFLDMDTYGSANPVHIAGSRASVSNSLMVNNGASANTEGNVCTAGIAFCVNSNSSFVVDAYGNSAQTGSNVFTNLVNTAGSNGTEYSYFATYPGLFQFSYNRVPSTGTIPNAAQSSTFINFAGGTGASQITLAVGSAANTQPVGALIVTGGATPSTSFNSTGACVAGIVLCTNSNYFTVGSTGNLTAVGGAFSGIVTVPNATTGSSTTVAANTAFVSLAIANLADNVTSVQATTSTVSCSSSGSMTFSMPFQEINYKKVVVRGSGCVGTATYTFPVAFSVIPSRYLPVGGSASSTTVSTTSVTYTSQGSQYEFLEGW